MTAQLLPLPEGEIARRRAQWPEYVAAFPDHPRSVWLTSFESILRDLFPHSSSADRKLTARHYAPFPLAAGRDVP